MGKWKPRLIRLELGKEYWVQYHHEYYTTDVAHCKFIKVTKCGYNFLDIAKNKCVRNHHLYPSKKLDPMGEMFFVDRRVSIKEVKKYGE